MQSHASVVLLHCHRPVTFYTAIGPVPVCEGCSLALTIPRAVSGLCQFRLEASWDVEKHNKIVFHHLQIIMRIECASKGEDDATCVANPIRGKPCFSI